MDKVKVLMFAVGLAIVLGLLPSICYSEDEWKVVEERLNAVTETDGKIFRTKITGLYHHDMYGNRVETKWRYKNGRYVSEDNIILLSVEGNEVTIDGDSWLSEPLLNGLPLPILSMSIEDDRTNKYYKDNVLVVDYGEIKREIRQIEGAVFSSWVIEEKPSGKIEIVISGDLELDKGYLIDNDGEYVEVNIDSGNEVLENDDLSKLNYPVRLYDSPETMTASVDGYTEHNSACYHTWVDLLYHDADYAFDGLDTMDAFYAYAHTVAGQWFVHGKAIVIFDCDGVFPEEGIIFQSATFGIYGGGKPDTLGIAPDLCITEVDSTSNTSIELDDYDMSLYGELMSDDVIAWADINVGTPGGPNEFDFNEVGLENIDKNGYTKVAVRNKQYDADEGVPSWSSGNLAVLRMWASEKGVGYEPYLVVYWVYADATEPSGFGVEQTGLDEVRLYWNDMLTSDYVSIRGMVGDCPTENTSGYEVYVGTDNETYVNGLDLNSTVYWFALWNIFMDDISNSVNCTIGGEDMEIEFAEWPTMVMFGLMGLAGFLMVLYIFWRKFLIMFSAGLVWLAVFIMSSNTILNNGWAQLAFVILMLSSFLGGAFDWMMRRKARIM